MHLAMNFVFSSIGKLLKFSHVERLSLQNIESEYLENLLNQLPSLSFLSSLVIVSANEVTDGNTIYHQIVRLPALKYCKLSLKGWAGDKPLPFCIDAYS
jgi:hypothetical protein